VAALTKHCASSEIAATHHHRSRLFGRLAGRGMQHHADDHSHGEGHCESQNDTDNRQRGDARRQDNAGPSSFAGGGRRKGDRLDVEGEVGSSGNFLKRIARRFWPTGCRRRSQGLR